jgi:hypothetical protein
MNEGKIYRIAAVFKPESIDQSLIPDMVSGIPMDQVIGLPFFHFSH